MPLLEHCKPETFEVPCRRCGQPVTLNLPDTGSRRMDETVVRMAEAGALHDECRQAQDAERRDAEEAELLRAKSARWQTLCPPLYYDSEEWVEAHPGKVNKAKIEEALKWEFGPRGLLLCGQRSGTGKTTSAWLVLKREFAAGRRIVALQCGEFARTATAVAREQDKAALRWVGELVRADVLLLDDLGKGKLRAADGTGKAAEELLFDVFDARARAERPTIVTTNSTGAELEASMSQERGAPFVRRLREFCAAINFDK